MVEVHRLPDSERIAQEAGDWLARLHCEDVDETDRERFRQWLEAHPSHRRVYDDMLRTWQRFERAGPLVRTVTTGHMLGTLQQHARPRPWLRAVAAGLAILAVLGWLAWSSLGSPDSMRTDVGQQAAVVLADGSRVDLNTNSAMQVEYNGSARIIRLGRGEAHFEVAHDAARPFWVIAGGTWIRAVGTAFDVYIRPASIEIMVTDGQVQFAAAPRGPARRPSDALLARTSHSLLGAGQKVQYDGAGAQIRGATPHELRRSRAWRSGTLEFDSQTLGEVLEELSRYTTRQIIVEDESLRSVRVGGTFKAGEQGVDALLAVLEQDWDVEVRREASERVHLRARQ